MAGKKPNPHTPADQRLKGRGEKPGPKPTSSGTAKKK